MSATISQPVAGKSSKSAAPFGAVALVAGALALGAVGIALGQGVRSTPAAGAVPADVQNALIDHRMGEKTILLPPRDGRMIQHQAELADRAAAAASTDGFLIQHQGELADRAAAAASTDGFLIQHQGELADRAAAANGAGYPTTIAGPKTGAQKGLGSAATVSTYPGKTMDAISVIGDPFAGKSIDDTIVSAPAADRWSVLATNPYSQGLLSQTGPAPVRDATGGRWLNHR